MSQKFEDFYSQEFDNVFDAAYALVGRREAALDATQEAFSRALARWGRLEKQPWKGGWVMTTALNLCKREARAANRQSPRFVVEPPPSAPVTDRVDLLEALRSLPLRQRQAAILYYLGDFPIAVVADLMNVSEGSIKRHLWRAREGLRRHLDPEHDRMSEGQEGGRGL